MTTHYYYGQATFKKCLEAKNTPANTQRAYLSDAAAFVSFNDNLGAHPKMSLKAAAIEWLGHLVSEGQSPSTLRRRRSAFNAFAECVSPGQGQTLSKHDFRIPPQTPPSPHPLPGGMADVDAMIDHCNDIRDRSAMRLILLMGKLGLRVSEAIAVTSSHYDHTNDTLVVEGKGSKSRILPLSQLLVDHIRDDWYHDDADTPVVGMANSTARKKITAIGGDLFDFKVASHDLRATFATDMYARRKDIVVVQRFLGHADVKTTQQYIGVNMDEMRAAL